MGQAASRDTTNAHSVLAVDSFTRWLDKIEPGSWADWVAGIATTLAVIFALVELALERGRARRQERASQASKVSAWFEESDRASLRDRAYISNASEGVIYDVLIAVTNGRVESDGSTTVKDFTKILSQIPPGVYRTSTIQGWGGMHFSPSIDLSFRDSSGRHWFRNNYGKLKEKKKDVFSRYSFLDQPVEYDEYTRVMQ
jgi:hypothetical protein